MPVVFADRLMAAMLNAGGVSASELARRVWGTIKDTRGYDVPRNRDRVGHYLRGTSHPNAANLAKIATALNVPVTELIEVKPMTKFKIYWTAASYLTIEAASVEEAEKWMRNTPLAEIRERSGHTDLEVAIEEAVQEVNE